MASSKPDKLSTYNEAIVQDIEALNRPCFTISNSPSLYLDLVSVLVSSNSFIIHKKDVQKTHVDVHENGQKSGPTTKLASKAIKIF